MKYKWDKKYLHWGLTAFLVIAASLLFFFLGNRFSLFREFMGKVFHVFSPFVYGLLIAYILNSALCFFEKLLAKPAAKVAKGNARKEFRFKRILAILITHLLTAGVVVGILELVIPQIFESIENLVNMLPEYAKAAVAWVNDLPAKNKDIEEILTAIINSASQGLTKWMNDTVMPQIDNIVASVTGGIISVVKAVFNVIIGAVISIYIMYHKEMFKAQTKRALYSHFKVTTANRIMEEAGYVKNAFGDFIVGKGLASLIVGAVCYIFTLATSMPYSALVSVIVCITNMIPLFGPFIGGAPSALLILLVDPMKGLIFIIFIIVLQLVDGQIISPKIIGSVSGISGFWIMFAILVFGGFFGIVGMMLSVPLMSVIYNAASRNNRKNLIKRGLPEETEIYLTIDSIDAETNKPIFSEPAAEKKSEKKEKKEAKKS